MRRVQRSTIIKITIKTLGWIPSTTEIYEAARYLFLKARDNGEKSINAILTNFTLTDFSFELCQ